MDQTDVKWPDDGVILYDGDCMLCSRWVKWVIARDPRATFRFTAIGSSYGRRLAESLSINPDDPESNAVIVGGRAYLYSDAAITIASRLPGYGWVRFLSLAPKWLRDWCYKIIARNRIRWFGRPQACDLPSPEWRSRMIER